jgi:hypothetical protein
MAKTLKLKAFEIETGELWNVAEIEANEDDFDLNNSTIVVQRNLNPGKDIDDWETKPLKRGQFFIVQFTGKLDSKNQEVYEGAIVEYTSRVRFDSNNKSLKEAGIVVWKDFSYKIDMFNPTYEDERFYSLNQPHLEVVGHALINKDYLKAHPWVIAK